MSTPTFATVALTTDSERQANTAPRARVSLADMPGIDGSFVQQAGLGSKEIAVDGFLDGRFCLPGPAGGSSMSGRFSRDCPYGASRLAKERTKS